MPYEQPFIHTTPKKTSAETNTPRPHQGFSWPMRILAIVGIIGVIVMIIALYYRN